VRGAPFHARMSCVSSISQYSCFCIAMAFGLGVVGHIQDDRVPSQDFGCIDNETHNCILVVIIRDNALPQWFMLNVSVCAELVGYIQRLWFTTLGYLHYRDSQLIRGCIATPFFSTCNSFSSKSHSKQRHHVGFAHT